jgi:hypothetical protein
LKISLAAALFAAILTVAVHGTGVAMDAMQGSMMKPSCMAGDPVVGVNTMKMTYMSHDQMKMKMAGMSDSQMHAMMMKNHVKLMCKSKAMAMGAKMMPSKM